MNFKNLGARTAMLAIGATALAATSWDDAAAAPARVVSKVNLRLGPGTNYGVLTSMPAGVTVDVENCAAEWCTVRWRGRVGYAIARNLDMGERNKSFCGA